MGISRNVKVITVWGNVNLMRDCALCYMDFCTQRPYLDKVKTKEFWPPWQQSQLK
ncbi:hypothetical protein PPNK14_39850 [Pectobacterium parmentieri]